MSEVISLNFSGNYGDGVGSNVSRSINGELFLDNILEEFAAFLRSSGFDYVRMVTSEDGGSWTFDKEYHRDCAAGSVGALTPLGGQFVTEDAFELPKVDETIKVGDVVIVTEDNTFPENIGAHVTVVSIESPRDGKLYGCEGSPRGSWDGPKSTIRYYADTDVRKA